MKQLFLSLLVVGGLLAGSTALAHEVYVLDKEEVQTAITQPHMNPVEVASDNIGTFMLSGAIAIAIVVAVFFVSFFEPIERIIDPALLRIKHYAPAITQLTIGLAFLAGGFYGAAFGTELPFTETFGTFAYNAKILFMLVGLSFIFGIYPRVISIIAAALLVPYVWHHGTYMFNYATYFGEVLTLILFGGSYSLVKTKENRIERVIERHWHKYKFLMLRIFFGASIIYASLYAKLIHSGLALQTVEKFNLMQFFPFEPSFIVLGAMITEIIIGIFILIGFEIRFVSLVFIGFLIASLLFFGEAVWPHIILFGTALAMFTHGYDKYTVSGFLNHRKDLEPVL